jgi:hypothetical protein
MNLTYNLFRLVQLKVALSKWKGKAVNPAKRG